MRYIVVIVVGLTLAGTPLLAQQTKLPVVSADEHRRSPTPKAHRARRKRVWHTRCRGHDTQGDGGILSGKAPNPFANCPLRSTQALSKNAA